MGNVFVISRDTESPEQNKARNMERLQVNNRDGMGRVSAVICGFPGFLSYATSLGPGQFPSACSSPIKSLSLFIPLSQKAKKQLCRNLGTVS